MDVMGALYQNQGEAGTALDPALAGRVRADGVVLLGRIADGDPSPQSRELARLNRQWLLSNDREARDDLTHRAAEVFIGGPAPTGPTLLVGSLCNEAAQQGRLPRAERWSYSAWLQPHPAGDQAIASMPSIDEANGILPASIRLRRAASYEFRFLHSPLQKLRLRLGR
jgi:hypothetical protein